MRKPPAKLHLTAELGHGLLADVGHERLGGALTSALDGELVRLGLPRKALVEVRPSEAARSLRFSVAGRVRPYPPQVLTRVWRAYAPPHHWQAPLENDHGGQVFPDRWLADALRKMNADERTQTIDGLAPAVMLEAIREAPSCLLDDEVVADYLVPAAAKDLRAVAGLADVLRYLVDLGVSLADPVSVASTLAGGTEQGLDGDLLAEHGYPALRNSEIQVLAHPDYLGSLLGRHVEEPVCASDETLDPSWRQALKYADEWLYSALGQPLPDLWLVPAQHLEGGAIEVVVFGTPSLRVRSFMNPLELAVLAPVRALPKGTTARREIDPASGFEIALVLESDLPPGAVGLDPAHCLLAIAAWELFRRRQCLLSIEDLHRSLASLATYFPAITAAASNSIDPADLIGALRLLRAERHSLQDLRGILTAMLDVFPPRGPGAAQRYADAALATLQQLTLDEHARQGELLAIRLEPRLEARLAEGHALSDAEMEHVREAAWSRLATPSGQGSPAFLATRLARRPLLDILAQEFAQMPVFGDDMVPFSRAVTVLATVSEHAAPAAGG
jgi:hypothetical protein